MSTTYTCQEDNCTKTSTDKTDFKKIEVRTGFIFAFVVCNEHAKKYGINTNV